MAEVPDIAVGEVIDDLTTLKLHKDRSLTEVVTMIRTPVTLQDDVPVDEGIHPGVQVPDDIVSIGLSVGQLAGIPEAAVLDTPLAEDKTL